MRNFIERRQRAYLAVVRNEFVHSVTAPDKDEEPNSSDEELSEDFDAHVYSITEASPGKFFCSTERRRFFSNKAPQSYPTKIYSEYSESTIGQNKLLQRKLEKKVKFYCKQSETQCRLIGVKQRAIAARHDKLFPKRPQHNGRIEKPIDITEVNRSYTKESLITLPKINCFSEIVQRKERSRSGRKIHFAV